MIDEPLTSAPPIRVNTTTLRYRLSLTCESGVGVEGIKLIDFLLLNSLRV